MAQYTSNRVSSNTSLPRGFIGQLFALLLHPRQFFSGMARATTTQWLLAAILILTLVATVTIRQKELYAAKLNQSPAQTGAVPSENIGQPEGSSAGSQDIGVPPVAVEAGTTSDPNINVGPPTGETSNTTTNASTTDVTQVWTTALIAGAGLILHWFIIAALLMTVSLLSLKAPNVNRNWQIAVWASLPLALMAGLQLLFYSAGGPIGRPGVAGIMPLWNGFSAQHVNTQNILLSVASRLTVFHIWSLLLLYLGCRYALQGRLWSIVVVLLLWMLLMIFIPIATGAVAVREVNEVAPLMVEPGLALPVTTGDVTPNNTEVPQLTPEENIPNVPRKG